MIELWAIVPSPTGHDPARHTLWLRGQLADVQTIIRRFAALCGRPQRQQAAGEYNYKLYLAGAGPEALDQVQSALRSIAPSGPAPGAAAPAARAGTVVAPPAERPASPPPRAPSLEEAIRERSAPAPSPAPAPNAPAFALEPPQTPAPPPAPASAAAAPSDDREPLFGAAVELEKPLTFEAFQVGSFNRFAHAASMSVVTSPGSMYNPLFVFGPPGGGKTHLLHAIGWALREQKPDPPVLATSGPRLARAARRARKTGGMAEFQALAQRFSALLIDDVHLLAVDEQNQEALAALLAAFFAAQKQVMMTSLYPPRSLGALEEALKFQINAGWSVDLKPLTREIQRDAVGPALARAGLEATEPAVEAVFAKLEGASFELPLWIARLKALAELRAAAGQPAAIADLLGVLFAAEPAPGMPAAPEEVEAALAALPPSEGSRGLPVAVFFPQGREAYGRFVARKLDAVMAENRWPLRVSLAHSQAYDAEQLHGVPFVIGEACEKAGARAAIVLGPAPGSGLAGRESELAHAVDHILRGLGLRLGWINFLRVMQPVQYLRAGVELYQAVQGAR